MDKKLLEQYIDTYNQIAHSISINMQSIQKEIFKGSSITPDQFNLMNVINISDTCTSSFLAKVLNVKKSTVTAIVNRLVDKNLIKRVFNEKDRRVNFLELTEQGQGILVEERQKILDVLMPMGNMLTVKQLEELELHLSVIDAQLKTIKKGIDQDEE